jgi:hypothetical protein
LVFPGFQRDAGHVDGTYPYVEPIDFDATLAGEEGLNQFYSIALADDLAEDQPSSPDSRNLGDGESPNTTVTIQGDGPIMEWYPGPFTVRMSAEDGTSGVRSIQYDLDGAGWSTWYGDTVIGLDGSHRLSYQSTDEAGNTEDPHTIMIRVDRTPPRRPTSSRAHPT